MADPSIEVTVRVNFSNSGQPDICNNGTNVPGNWGLLDFDGVGGNDTKEWVENGYPGEVNSGRLLATATPSRTPAIRPRPAS